MQTPPTTAADRAWNTLRAAMFRAWHEYEARTLSARQRYSETMARLHAKSTPAAPAPPKES